MHIERIFGARHRQHESGDLLQRAGYVRQHASGIYSYLTLGLRSLRRIEAIVRDEMDRTGAQEILMPLVHDGDVWKATGRYGQIDETLLRFQDRRGHDMVLGMTHEEIAAELAASELHSWRSAGIVVYQIQTKFRDEVRARGGLLRTREFLMKDAYSLHLDDAGLCESYEEQAEAYERIFGRVGLESTLRVVSPSGDMGGQVAHEFMTLMAVGEDHVLICEACGRALNREVAAAGACACGGAWSAHRAVEVGNIFQLGTRYSESLGAYVDDKDGRRRPLVMGSYGIGISRLLATLTEQGKDEHGVRLPRAVAAIDAHVIDLHGNGEGRSLCDELRAAGFTVILDEREVRAGEKFADADLIGASDQIILGRTYQTTGEVEVKRRWEGDRIRVPRDAVASALPL